MPVTYERRDTFAIITFQNPPLNIFGQAMRADLQSAIAQARADRPERLILTGAGQAFVAGADAKEFGGPALAPHLNAILAELVALPFPTIAAINGPALGGGLEIALACRMRIATAGATLGLPEVTLGIVPGAGGTQRLPRLIGVAGAVDLIGTGRTISGAQALDCGLVDALSETPLAQAIALDGDRLRRALAADHRPAPAPDAAAITQAHALAHRRAAGQTAPHIAIDLVAAAATEPLEPVLLRERAAFLSLRQTEQAAALRHIFFAERASLAQGKTYPAPDRPIDRALVVGGGLMGAGIAYAFLSAGLWVHLVETDATGQSRAQANLDKLIAEGVARGALTDAPALRARLSFGIGFAALPEVDLAIEAAFESMEVKRTIFAALQKALPASTILATNTSYLDINALAEDIAAPERFLGLHFFAPAHVMKLLEIVRGATTSAATLGRAFSLAKRLAKIPVVSGVCDGFIGNRILSRYRRAADVMLLEGSEPRRVDMAMRAFGMAMGPYEAQDLSGLDIAYANRQRQNLRNRTDLRYVPIADHLVEDLGRLGRKTGAGWYDYDAAGKPIDSEAVYATILRASDAAGITRIPLSIDEIAQRAAISMVLEAIDILQEGVAARPQDIDLVLVHGYGFARWRGGLMQFADSFGLPALCAEVERLAAKDPLSWAVPKLLRQLVDEGRTFASLNREAGRPRGE